MLFRLLIFKFFVLSSRTERRGLRSYQNKEMKMVKMLSFPCYPNIKIYQSHCGAIRQLLLVIRLVVGSIPNINIFISYFY